MEVHLFFRWSYWAHLWSCMSVESSKNQLLSFGSITKDKSLVYTKRRLHSHIKLPDAAGDRRLTSLNLLASVLSSCI